MFGHYSIPSCNFFKQFKHIVLAAELRAESPSAPVPLRRDPPAAGVEHAAPQTRVRSSRVAFSRKSMNGPTACWSPILASASATTPLKYGLLITARLGAQEKNPK